MKTHQRPGGQRIDYRVSELRSLMKDYLLFPSLTPSKDKIRENGIQLERETRVWPLVNSDSALYSLPGTSFGHILKLIVQPNLRMVEYHFLVSTIENKFKWNLCL